MPSPLVTHLTSPNASLSIEPWHDPVVEVVGHDARALYVERFWLPTLGPAAVLLIRRLNDELDRAPSGVVTDPVTMSGWLGVKFRPTKESVLVNAINRLCLHGFARTSRPDDPSVLAVRRRLPDLSYRQLGQAPAALRYEHATWIDRSRRRTEEPRDRLRIRHLAAALLEFGDDPDVVERQLHRWGCHPALAHDALQWARHPSRWQPAPVGPRGPAPAERCERSDDEVHRQVAARSPGPATVVRLRPPASPDRSVGA